jgi:hypothetical protein
MLHIESECNRQSGAMEKKLKAFIHNFLRPLQNAQFCFSARKIKIITRRIHCCFENYHFHIQRQLGKSGYDAKVSLTTPFQEI